MPSPEERQARIERIEAIGRELQELARGPPAPLAYREFESRLRALHELGFFPDKRLISAVGQATHRGL